MCIELGNIPISGWMMIFLLLRDISGKHPHFFSFLLLFLKTLSHSLKTLWNLGILVNGSLRSHTYFATSYHFAETATTPGSPKGNDLYLRFSLP